MFSNWKVILRRLLVLIAMLICVAAIVHEAGKRITTHNEEEFQRNIHSVMDQNADTISMLLDKHKTLVESMASRMRLFYKSPQEARSYILRQHTSQNVYKFMRVGFIYPDGNGFASDGNSGNLALRDYFQRSMKGEIVITPTMTSYLGKNHINVNVISAPVYDKDKIVGVVFETIPNEVFADVMNKGVLAEFGSNVLVDNNGDIIANDTDSQLLTKYNDLLPFVTLESHQKRLSIWEQRVKNIENTTTMYFDRDGGQYLHFATIHLDRMQEPVHIAVLLSVSTIKAQTTRFSEEVYGIMGMILLIAALSVLYYFIDIQRQESARRKELEAIAYTSTITGSDNYAYFKSQLQKRNVSGYLAYMGMREFEVIRSTLGTEKATYLIQKTWELLKENLGTSDIAGHISDDTFAIFFVTRQLSLVEERLKSLNLYLANLEEKEAVPPLKAFFGLTEYDSSQDIDVALSNANIARQSIAAKWGSLYALYGEEYTKKYLANTAMEKSFEKNIQDKKFEVWYQPKYDCFTNTIIGAEALIRLRDDKGKLVSPAKFVELFEQDGLIRHLDEYVFRTVCGFQQNRQQENKHVIPISINLSRVSLYYQDIVQRYDDIITSFGIRHDLVPLEITESATVNNKTIRALMYGFCANGFHMHLDDFGTGYSSLSSLNQLPFENIKIDKSLIDYIGNANGNAMIKHIVQLSKELGMTVTAEGVENQAQIDFLKDLGCHSIQGYFFSKPLPEADFVKLLDK